MADPKRRNEFIDLLRLHTSRILGYLDTLLLNRADAEDLFQETSIVLWQKFDEFKPGTNFLAWALRIADFKVMNFRTTRSRHTAMTNGLRDALIAEIVSKPVRDADDQLAMLAGCMERLSQVDRELVMLCYAEGTSVSEVANSRRRSQESVYHSLRRIRKWLLACIQRQSNLADMPASHRYRISDQEDA